MYEKLLPNVGYVLINNVYIVVSHIGETYTEDECNQGKARRLRPFHIPVSRLFGLYIYIYIYMCVRVRVRVRVRIAFFLEKRN